MHTSCRDIVGSGFAKMTERRGTRSSCGTRRADTRTRRRRAGRLLGERTCVVWLYGLRTLSTHSRHLCLALESHPGPMSPLTFIALAAIVVVEDGASRDDALISVPRSRPVVIDGT